MFEYFHQLLYAISYDSRELYSSKQVPISGHLRATWSAHGVPGDGFDRESLSQAHATLPPQARGPENWSEAALPFNCRRLFVLQFATSPTDRDASIMRLSGHPTDRWKDIAPLFHWRLINSLIKPCRSAARLPCPLNTVYRRLPLETILIVRALTVSIDVIHFAIVSFVNDELGGW